MSRQRVLSEEEILNLIQEDYVDKDLLIDDIPEVKESSENNYNEGNDKVTIKEAIVSLEKYLDFLNQKDCPNFIKNFQVETALNDALIFLRREKKRKNLKNISIFEFINKK